MNWNPHYSPPEEINNGQRIVQGDSVSIPEDFNKNIENNLFAVQLAQEAHRITQPIDNTQSNIVGTARFEIDPTTGGLRAIEMKGEQGDIGLTPVITVQAELLGIGEEPFAIVSGAPESPLITFGIPYSSQGTPGVNSTGGSDMASVIIPIDMINWEDSTDERGAFVIKIEQARHGLPASSGLLAFAKPFIDDNATTEIIYDSPIVDNDTGDITIYSNENWSGIVVCASGIMELVDTQARVDIAALEERVNNLEFLGSKVGTYALIADLPTNVSEFAPVEVFVKDWAIVQEDFSIHMIDAIDGGGNITWVLAGSFDTDISMKMDLITGGTAGNFIVQDADGNAAPSNVNPTTISTLQSNLSTHTGLTNNPHSVTATQVGLGNVNNTSDADKPVSMAQETRIGEVQTNLDTHAGLTNNPHAVTAAQVDAPTNAVFTGHADDTALHKTSADITAIGQAHTHANASTLDGIGSTNLVSTTDRTNWDAAQSASQVSTAIGTHNGDANAHPAIRQLVTDLAFLADGSFNSTTGDVVLTRRDGSTIQFNTHEAALSKDFFYDSTTEELVFVKADNTEVRVPVSQFVHEYTGSLGDQIQITIGTGNAIQATVRAGTITRTQLESGVQASLTLADNASATFAPINRGATVDRPGTTDSFLRGDGTWAAPPGGLTLGTTATTAAQGDRAALSARPNNTTTFLRGDGSWATPPIPDIAPFRQNVTWSGSVGNFTFTLAATTHGKGVNPLVTTLINGEEINCGATIAVNGNITIRSNANLAGVVLEVR